MKRRSLFTLVTLLLVLGTMGFVFGQGAEVPIAGSIEVAPRESVEKGGLLLAQNLGHPLPRLLLQLLVIIVVSRLVGALFARFGQPAAVGEMAAGLLLGPSLLGWLAPGAFAFVFPESSMDSLHLFSQIGVCLFMFAVGMEVDPVLFRAKANTAFLVSHAGIVLSFALGVLLAFFLYPAQAAVGAGFSAFALFLGISMSITAFPMLMRILQERRLTRTTLGTLAISCAAIGDVTAWTLLAFIVAIVQTSGLGDTLLNLLLFAAFLAVLFFVVRPGLRVFLGGAALSRGEPSQGTLAGVLGVVVASSLVAEVIGMHALFGAFLAGLIMPTNPEFRHGLTVRVEKFSSVLLLPLFFAYIGLRTDLRTLGEAGSWSLCLLVIAIATFGKLGGTALAGRWKGMPWRSALQLGALMNTRGLMELIVLNLGYELGILSDEIFAALVVMALVTTMLTGPLLSWLGARGEDAPQPKPV